MADAHTNIDTGEEAGRRAGSEGSGRKPEWLRVPVRAGGTLKEVKDLLRRLHLNTVCVEANCPNRMECYSSRTATFMILGSICTRNCRFCKVGTAAPGAVDEDEPRRLAEAVRSLGLEHVVITSVTRDDLPDGGAFQFARAVREVRTGGGEKVTSVELLIPDFLGDEEALRTVVDAAPEIVNHNVETVPRLYPDVRPEAQYERSLQLLRRVKEWNPQIYTKSGIMVGMGERRDEVEAVMDDLRAVGCDFLTIGQYLPPSRDHYQVREYVTPERFEEYRRTGYEKGFVFMASAPFVRSSYKAAEALSPSSPGEEQEQRRQ